MNDILSTLFTTTPLTQAQIDWLVKKNGVPPLALACDPTEAGFVIGTGKVEVDGHLFDFVSPDDEEGGSPETALIFAARNRCGDPVDLVAWCPKTNRVAALYGRTAILGENNVLAPRIDGALAVHRSPLQWLQAGRHGVVLIDQKRAWRQLEGVRLAAEDLEHGLALRKVLTPPLPSIMVPSVADAERRAA